MINSTILSEIEMDAKYIKFREELYKLSKVILHGIDGPTIEIAEDSLANESQWPELSITALSSSTVIVMEYEGKYIPFAGNVKAVQNWPLKAKLLTKPRLKKAKVVTEEPYQEPEYTPRKREGFKPKRKFEPRFKR